MEIVNHYDLELEQMYFNTCFLHRDHEKIILREQPEGFVEDMSKVCAYWRNLVLVEAKPKSLVSSIW